jgi:hypothetical protein
MQDDNSELSVGRDCLNSGDPVRSGYCGWHQMNQAIFNGARGLGYEMYVVPFYKADDPLSRHDLFMLNPASAAVAELRNALYKNRAIKVLDPKQLKQYGW